MKLSTGAGDLLRLIRHEPALTRAEVGELTGWARMTVNARIDELLAAGLLSPAGAQEGLRGRPAARFAFEPSAGRLLVADVGASGARLARCDLAGGVLAARPVPLRIGDGPNAVLDVLERGLRDLDEPGGPPLWGVGVSLPGPIEQSTGRVVSPPIMTGWDGLVVPERFGPVFGVPVLVENDANAMAWGERCLAARGSLPPSDDLLFVKVGTGIGAGIVAQGRVLHGAKGAAGDLGHTRADVNLTGGSPGAEAPLCRCGKIGCVEAYSGGWAIARDLTADGEPAADVDDVLRLLREGNARAVQRVRRAGAILGGALAQAVSLLNPSEIVVGGQLAVAGEHLLSGIRQHVAADSLPLATGDLTIRVSERPLEAGVTGLADALATWVLGPDHLPRILASVDGPGARVG